MQGFRRRSHFLSGIGPAIRDDLFMHCFNCENVIKLYYSSLNAESVWNVIIWHENSIYQVRREYCSNAQGAGGGARRGSINLCYLLSLLFKNKNKKYPVVIVGFTKFHSKHQNHVRFKSDRSSIKNQTTNQEQHCFEIPSRFRPQIRWRKSRNIRQD